MSLSKAALLSLTHSHTRTYGLRLLASSNPDYSILMAICCRALEKVLLVSELAALESLAGRARNSCPPSEGIHASGSGDADAPAYSSSSSAAGTSDTSKAGVHLILAGATPRHQLEPLLALHRELVHRFSASRSVSPACTESGAS